MSWEILHDDVAFVTKEEASAELRKLIDQTVARAVDDSLSYGHRVAFEVSGGIDSTIATSRGLLALSKRGMEDKAFGVSITYPYYEFRREDRFISDVYADHGMRRISLDGRKLLPFAGVKRTPVHNIPNLAVVGAAQHTAVVDAAAKHGASLLFNGLGGDTLFGMGPTGQYRFHEAPRRPEWFTRRGWKIVTHHWKQLIDYFDSGERSSKRQFFTGAHIDDGWADTIIAQPRGVRRQCLFTNPDIIPLAARLWSQRPNGASYKSVLREVFAKDLPQSIRRRRHKIAYDGLYVRGYRSALPDLEKLISRSEDALSEAGIKTPHFLEAVHEIARGDLTDDRLVSSVLACLLWMEKKNDLS
ncbi:asparagine synthase-related protein [Rhodohalobacter sp. 8-1]|uniref:asparagine synthase-related protein n=1 Tax=Rhodohalobacter sp. 8-1 TaxID=3131972 RepID=UPI0030EBCFB5